MVVPEQLAMDKRLTSGLTTRETVNKFSILNSQFSTKKGFTMIEIMVAIAILSILLVIGITSYINALKVGRDAKRKQDLHAITLALEQYRSVYGAYPEEIKDTNQSVTGCWWDWESGTTLNGQNDQFLQILVTGSFLRSSVIEKSPVLESNESKCSYKYVRNTNVCGSGKTYAVLFAYVEGDSGESDVRPSIFDSCYPDSLAPPGKLEVDKRDWVVFLEE